MITTLQHLESIAAIQGKKVYEVLDNLVTQQLNTMKLSPLQMNTLSKEFEFNYEGVRLLAEADYLVEVNPNNDSVEVIGEVSEVFGPGVVEVPAKIIKAEMKNRYSEEIEYIRTELKAEKKSVLRDFGARVF